MIIDFHVHIFPDNIARSAIEYLSGKARIQPNSDGTLSSLKSLIKSAGIDYSVVLPIATKPQQAATINSFAAQITGRDGIISFGSIHPFSENWKRELDRVKELGLTGIKFHPEYQDFFVDDERIFPVLEYAARLGLIIVFHGGADLGFDCEIHCTPKRVKKLLRSINDIKLVIAHTGGYRCWDDVEEYLVGENVYLDTSYTLNTIDEKQFLRIVRNHGADKILFATDLPWGNPRYDIKRMMDLPLSRDEQDRIMYKNALNLLKL